MSPDHLKIKSETAIEKIRPKDAKNIKLELEYIQEKISKYKKDFNLKHEHIRKFLITFLEKFEQINNKGEMELNTKEDSEDGLKDIIKSVGEEILNKIRNKKKSLKALKAIVNFIRAIKKYG